MIQRSKSERVAIFADVQNLYYGSQQEYNSRLDFRKFLDWAVAERSMIRAVAYIVEDGEHDQEAFKAMLWDAGFEIRSKPLIKRRDGSKKGNWDIAIAVDAMAIGPRVDTVIIASGDGDFSDLADHLINTGVRVEASGFKSSTGHQIIDASTEYRAIPEDLCPIPVKRNSTRK